MFLNKVFFISLLSACIILNAVEADDCEPANRTISFGLCEELQLLEDLVPRSSVNTLIKNHMANDIRFRKAVQYLQSSTFKKDAAKIDATATFQSFLKTFSRAGVNIDDLNSVTKIFDCLIIPNIEEADTRTSFYSESIIHSRSLESFAEQFIQLIPRNEFVETLKAQIKDNAQFAKFYKIIRDPSFRTRVTQGFKNADIARSVKQLRRHQVDLCKLMEIAFNLLYMGPSV